MHKTRAGIRMQDLKVLFILFHTYKAALFQEDVLFEVIFLKVLSRSGGTNKWVTGTLSQKPKKTRENQKKTPQTTWGQGGG